MDTIISLSSLSVKLVQDFDDKNLPAVLFLKEAVAEVDDTETGERLGEIADVGRGILITVGRVSYRLDKMELFLLVYNEHKKLRGMS